MRLSKSSFCMLPSILIFDFDLILGLFFTFLGPNGLFFIFYRVSQKIRITFPFKKDQSKLARYEQSW